MQKSAIFNMLNRQNHVAISTSRRRRNNIFVEWEGNKYDDNEKVDDCANSTHCLRSVSSNVVSPLQGSSMRRDLHFRSSRLAKISTFQACLHEDLAQPSDQRECQSESNSAECQRCDNRLAIALKGVCDNADAGNGESQK